MNPLIKNILIAVVVLILIFIAYRVFFATEPEAPLSSETVADLPAEEGDLLSLLLELKSISLSDALLTNPAFVSLQDFTVELQPETVGRRNPFAPIGTDAAPATVPATTTPPVTP